MKYIDVSSLMVGMILGEDIYDDQGMLYASMNSKITFDMLKRIKNFDIDVIKTIEEHEIVYIEEEEKNRMISKIFKIAKSSLFYGKDLYGEIFDLIKPYWEALFVEEYSVYLLKQLDDIDDYTIGHSVRVGLISALIGTWQNLSEEKILDLSVAGLLCQVGKIKVDSELLTKADELSSDELKTVKSYVEGSDDLLDKIKFLSTDVIMAVHHSTVFLDGTGYPSNIDKRAVHPLAKIVSVANVFDAATQDKVYRKSVCPFTIADELFDMSIEKLNPSATTPLIENIKKCFMGLKVRLDNGEEGEIVFLNKFDSNKPIVKVGKKVYDLSRDDVKIVSAAN